MTNKSDNSPRENPLAEFPPIPHIEAYKPGIDRTLLIENLKLSPEQRIMRGVAFTRKTQRIRGSARRIKTS